MENFDFLFAAFAIGWAVFMGLLFWLYRKVARIRQEVAILKQNQEDKLSRERGDKEQAKDAEALHASPGQDT